MNHLLTCSLLAAMAGIAPASLAQASVEPATELVHTREPFSFAISRPYAEVFPLFGAHEERKWALHFDPEFLYPVPAHDQPGMVFTTVQEGMPRVWLNTAFDAATGHVQYVYWIADIIVALIDIRVAASGTNETKVDVIYERTALHLEANEQVLHMAHNDANSGSHWAEMITRCLQSANTR
ncbi:MAG TPA: hypothetical protein VMT53_12310 [Terriglobales bacterium]|nr:hypothetical protein [Terriglobales bacterium]